ncbi:hypothetical protein OHB53_08305 [Streptomyces sp. NBC_00056]|uniref:hypothetical protein n=1 Tax=unclassified Streptomyces TaxID=2593676 RepID=UPI002252D237|nr:hypothetical protein [Streptomyces sp. NBC_00063]MCX5441394.1 hypothetical protein [Streptomyces sp. NBC_00063]
MPALAHRFGALSAMTALGIAYVITRSLGTSVADWITRGGLGLDLSPVTLASTVAITRFFGYLAMSRRDTGVHTAARGSGRATRGGA